MLKVTVTWLHTPNTITCRIGDLLGGYVQKRATKAEKWSSHPFVSCEYVEAHDSAEEAIMRIHEEIKAHVAKISSEIECVFPDPATVAKSSIQNG